MRGRDIGSAAGMGLGTFLGGPAGAAIGSIAGSIFGGLFDGDDNARADAAFSRAMAEIEAIGAPPETAKEIIYKNFVQVGIEPQLAEKAVTLAAPKVAEIQEAPELRSAKMEALRGLREAGRGETLEQRAALQQGRLQAQRDTEAKIQQIKQQFQQRGGFSPSLELAAMLQAESAGSAQEAEERLKMQDMARRSALEAQLKAGGLASDISRQEFDMARTRAGALDEAAMARFNQAVARQTRDIEAERARQQRMMGTAQRISEANVARSQEEALRQKTAQERDWYNKYRYGTTRAEMYGGQASREQERAQQESARSAEMGRGLGQALTGVIGDTRLSWGGGGSGSSGWDWSRSITNPAEEKEADISAGSALRRYGYPG